MDRSDLLLENRPHECSRERAVGSDCVRPGNDSDVEATVEIYQNFVRDLNRSPVFSSVIDFNRG